MKLESPLLRRRILTALLVFAAILAFLFIGWVGTLQAQTTDQPANTGTAFSVHATHLLGFQDAPNNATGILSLQSDALQFQKEGKPAVQVKLASIRGVFLGEQSRQVGGTAMMVTKAAVPYGGGRMISAFAHKKYDTLAFEYIDSKSGFHGAILQLDKGQGDVLSKELASKGVRVNAGDDEKQTKQRSTEIANENK